ncbi:ArgE/DapE family deacylase [Vibrio astriarenae]
MEDRLIKNIMDSVASRRELLLQDLSMLVSLDSTLGKEHSAQKAVKEIYQGLGLKVEEVEINLDELSKLPGYSPPVTSDTDGRMNIIGTHTPKERKGRSLILNGHMDVVPAGPSELWSRDPFEPYIKGDWLYGRGSGDMKAGIVAYCHALAALHDLGYQPASKVYLQSVIEEECTGNGALACLNAGYRADAAIIPEPFGQTCLVSQLGVMWFKLKLYGKPAHVLDTSNGQSVFDGLNQITDELKKLEKAWNKPSCRHHHYTEHEKPINFNLGKVNGGDWPSTVACYCEAEYRVGFFPGAQLDEVKASIEQTIGEVNLPEGMKAEVEYSGFQAEGCEIEEQSPLITSVKHSHQLVTSQSCNSLASTATTDCRFFQLYGDTPATCYGPLAENIHGIDERVSITSTIEVAQVLAVFIAMWCGLEKR